ncbi:MAG: hypothetical protein LBH00_06130, partial [Planctomycetaceae bacterium]|nr:hypothetical protein [Planctomycetaceae bacterium]
PISGATGENKNQLTLTDSLKDKYVRATRTNSNNKKVSSDAKQVNGGGSDEATVTVSGTYKVGSKLTASSDPGKTGETFVNDFIWEYAYNADGSYYSITGTGVTGEYGSELTIDADLDGKYIRAKRTLSSGPLFYSDSKKVGGGDEPKVTVTGETKVGAILTATSTGDGFSGGFIWELADSKTATSGTPISGASGSTLTIYASLATKYVRAKKENSNLASSYAASEWMGPIAAADTQAGGDDATARTAENLMRSLEDAGMNVVE